MQHQSGDDVQIPDRFDPVAWCIVPYDAEERSPIERAKMLNDLGFSRMAWDWREEHLPELQEELRALQKHDIELTAAWLWVDHRASDGLLEEHTYIMDTIAEDQVSTSFWVGIDESFFETLSDQEKLEKAIWFIGKLRDHAVEDGNAIALYNHGGWFGRPENQVRIIEELGKEDVGIVYNFHHGHDHIDRFPEMVELMLPHLWTVNLNGMDPDGEQIMDIGSGKYEKQMIRTLIQAGYNGQFGIIDHRHDEDTREVLKRNKKELVALLEEMDV